jgi:nitroimidazol reductase NimA-like FMN-containing flavoprotein (pyridoxamine 5'-phosphate oxidase superfamily)
MRRKDREITDIDNILDIIVRNKVCRLGMAENNNPYIVPLNYGYTYKDGVLTFYFHGAHEGKKIDILKTNNKACFEIDGGHALIKGEAAAHYSFAFESVIGFGAVEFLTSREDKIFGLDMLMKHQVDTDKKFEYSEQDLTTVNVYKLTVEEFTGKRRVMPESKP